MRIERCLSTFISIAFFFVAQGAHAQSRCSELFLETAGGQMNQAVQDLAHLRLKLDIAQSRGTSSTALTALKKTFVTKEAALIQYFETNKIMTRQEMKAQMIEEIKKALALEKEGGKELEKQKEELQKEIEISLAPIDGRRIVFNRVAPGSFKMGELRGETSVEITRPFEMAATQTTQIVWQKAVEAAQRRFPGKYDALPLNPSGVKGGLNPVERVSYNEVELWLQAVNELSVAHDPVIEEIMPGQNRNSIFRLPTEAEWEFVVRARGDAQSIYSFGDNKSDLVNYAWFKKNATSTHPVATKAPLEFDELEFYDMHGNVWEWTSDADQEDPPGGVDPHVKGDANSERIIRGGSWSDDERAAGSGHRAKWWPQARGGMIGFRLVRAAAP